MSISIRILISISIVALIPLSFWMAVLAHRPGNLFTPLGDVSGLICGIILTVNIKWFVWLSCGVKT